MDIIEEKKDPNWKKTQTEIVEMKNTVSKLKHTWGEINSKSETAEEKN